jgi:hypothetical protein
MGKFLFIIVASVLLTGCGTVYESRRVELLKTAKVEDYGPKPPADYQEKEKAFVLSLLKDPESARFKIIGEPVPQIIQSAFASPRPLLVWQHFLNVNAKNSFGGYTGYQPYIFSWRDGEIVAYLTSDSGFWIYLK